MNQNPAYYVEQWLRDISEKTGIPPASDFDKKISDWKLYLNEEIEIEGEIKSFEFSLSSPMDILTGEILDAEILESVLDAEYLKQ